jgi:hypothetical protein
MTISINEAANQGIGYLRKSVWAIPLDHLKIDILDGKPGPWVHLYSPFNRVCNGEDPVGILCLSLDYDEPEWEVYEGPLADSDEYKAAQAEYDIYEGGL